MRAAVRRPDGTVALSQINKSQVDLRRYMLFREGMTVLEIARSENMEPAKIERSVKHGRSMFEADQQIRLRDAKYESAIENEQIRRAVRKKVSHKLVNAIDRLLDGTRPVIETDKITGAVTIHEVIDPEIISLGIDAATRTMSLAERPMPSQTIVNIQNNNGDSSIRASELSYEERIERIARSQSPGLPESEDGDDIPMSRQTIEAEAREVADTPETPEELF